MLKSSVLVVTLLAACSDPPVTLAPTDPTTLEPTLDALAAFGEKGAGSTAGQMAAMYIQGKFMDLGLTDVHTESFHFPRWQLMDKSFSVTIDGATTTPGFDVFEAAGAGSVDALVVDAGTATPGDLQNLDLDRQDRARPPRPELPPLDSAQERARGRRSRDAVPVGRATEPPPGRLGSLRLGDRRRAARDHDRRRRRQADHGRARARRSP